ncbi:hypothetical protein C5167_029843 [Papaver somniferum]|uniref:uncharacterized protein LOC113328496 isoform X2 n=1 Tax=Papaver somniferum TaxID=3469 RepID=UPI000E6FC7B7|nr:uncharacterized protein LOC113328496 isoform X2 [Papaver somniferum]RZC87294.1 hypothetical protein C5167_029843 [Papaver somniferum]
MEFPELGPPNVPSGDADDRDESHDGYTTEEDPIDEKPEPSRHEVVIDAKEMLEKEKKTHLPWSTNWIQEMLDSANDPSAHFPLLVSDSGGGSFHFDGTQWSPSPEQTRILEMLYSGGLRSPTAIQINKITDQLIKYGNIKVMDVYLWFQEHRNQERQEQTSSSLSPKGIEGLTHITETPTSSSISKRGKGKAVSTQEKSGKRKVVSDMIKLNLSVDTGVVIPKKIDPTPPRVSKRTVSVEEKSGRGKVVSMPSEMSGPVSQEQEGSGNSRYDSTGKPLPINFEKQREQIPTVEECIDVRANIIFLDRDNLEESNTQNLSPQETSLPTTISSSASSTQGEESRPEGQNNTGIDRKKRRWFKLFSWWQKK